MEAFGQQLGIHGLRLIFQVDNAGGLIQAQLGQLLLILAINDFALCRGDRVPVRIKAGMTQLGRQRIGVGGRKLMLAPLRLAVPIGRVIAGFAGQIAFPQAMCANNM